MKKVYKIKGMHCNSCSTLIENELKDKVKSVKASYANETAEIEFDENKVSEKEIKDTIDKLGYTCLLEDNSSKKSTRSYTFGWIVVALSLIIVAILAYYLLLPKINLPNIQVPELGENTSLLLLFAAGVLTGFHCVSMCGGFVVSYTAKNALNGHKGFTQHLVYGGSKVLSYTIIGGIFGLIGGLIAFSVMLRGYVAIFAGIFMIFYALSMFGLGFFKRFQFNPKFLTNAASSGSSKFRGPYSRPFITGLLNGLFIACGPLQAMYLYAAGTGNILIGASSLAAFGLGTVPVMIGFGSLATVISNKATRRILKISAILVLILGLIMLNRGLTLTGSQYSYATIKTNLLGTNQANTVNAVNGTQEVNMSIDASGYSPNSFVVKKGVKVTWNIDVKELTSCNKEILVPSYNIDVKLKQGLNVIEFTPDKTGTIPFSCWMGMLHGNFIVTDSGTATSEQIKTSAPSSGSSCSMGSGGSSCGCGM